MARVQREIVRTLKTDPHVLGEEDALEQVRNDMMKKGCTAEAATRQVERLRWYNYHADDKLAGQDDEAWQLVDATVDDTPGEEICDSPKRGRTESPEREAMTADLILAFTKGGGIALHEFGDDSGCHRSRRAENHFSKGEPITGPLYLGLHQAVQNLLRRTEG